VKWPVAAGPAETLPAFALGRPNGVVIVAWRLQIWRLVTRLLGLPPVTRMARWVDVRPDVIGRMLARGAALGSAVDAAKAYPDLFPSAEAAKKALQRGAETKSIGTNPYEYYSTGECPDALPIEVSYRPAGNGQKTRRAFVPAGRLTGFRNWLEGLVGPLVHYEVVVQPTPPPRTISGVKIQAGSSKKPRGTSVSSEKQYFRRRPGSKAFVRN
jgi:hypothetical protein